MTSRTTRGDYFVCMTPLDGGGVQAAVYHRRRHGRAVEIAGLRPTQTYGESTALADKWINEQRLLDDKDVLAVVADRLRTDILRGT